jgi:DNA-binding transcriptional MerR regulator
MLSINEICGRAGISINTFQYWRRNDRKLLPKPMGVDKKVIYFDDSILERIQFIRDQRAAGRKLEEIEALFESCEAIDDPFTESSGQPDRKIAASAVILGKLAAQGAAFQNLLADQTRQIQELFHDFQALMAEGRLPTFLSALSANGLGNLDRHVLTRAQAAAILNLSTEKFDALVQRGIFTGEEGLYALDQLLKWLDGKLARRDDLADPPA